MSTSKKIIITLLLLAVLFVLFKVTEPAQAEYGFSRLRGVGGLEQASVGEIIVRVISWVMAIVGLICVVFIIYGGVMYATSGGSEEHITRGKKILLWAIVGLIISILAFTIANAVVTAIGGEGGGGAAGGKCYNTEIGGNERITCCATDCKTGEVRTCTPPSCPFGYTDKGIKCASGGSSACIADSGQLWCCSDVSANCCNQGDCGHSCFVGHQAKCQRKCVLE